MSNMVNAEARCALRLNSYPILWNDLTAGKSLHPHRRSDYSLAGRIVEPRAPPGITAVGNNVVAACGHQAKVVQWIVRGCRQITEQEFGAFEVPLAPGDVVRKDAEPDILNGIAKSRDGQVVIIFGEAIGRINRQIVSPSNMNGDSDSPADLVFEVERWLGQRQGTEIEFLAQFGFDSFKVAWRLEKAVESGLFREMKELRVKSQCGFTEEYPSVDPLRPQIEDLSQGALGDGHASLVSGGNGQTFELNELLRKNIIRPRTVQNKCCAMPYCERTAGGVLE